MKLELRLWFFCWFINLFSLHSLLHLQILPALLLPTFRHSLSDCSKEGRNRGKRGGNGNVQCSHADRHHCLPWQGLEKVKRNFLLFQIKHTAAVVQGCDSFVKVCTRSHCLKVYFLQHADESQCLCDRKRIVQCNISFRINPSLCFFSLLFFQVSAEQRYRLVWLGGSSPAKGTPLTSGVQEAMLL